MNTQLEKQAEQAFPLTDLAGESSVLHARKAWLKAKKYLDDNDLTPKPLIGVRLREEAIQRELKFH